MAVQNSKKIQFGALSIRVGLLAVLFALMIASGAVAAGQENTVASIADLICEGRFVQASEMLEKARGESNLDDSTLSKLGALVEAYENIQQDRQASRQAAYKEQLEKLDKLKTGVNPDKVTDPNDPNYVATDDPNDTNKIDLSDPNDVRQVLSVIARAREFADDAQRKRLLSDPYVTDVIQKAIDHAAGFEARGKWVEAYTNCYGWLSAIDPNNKGYSDYADELLDKAEIAASFEDSPCESSEERYIGVKKDMFTLAVYALGMDYVELLDYRQMANKALERCKLLGEVLGNEERFGAAAADSNEPGSRWFTPPDKQQLAAWLSAITAVQDEVNAIPAGPEKKDLLNVFEKTLMLNKATAQLPEPILIAHFTEGALAALDRYTTMVWPQQMREFEKNMMNEFTGIGVEISKRTGELSVASLLPDTPAYRAGLDAGDVIEAVDGLETRDMSLICAVHKITGPKGTKVSLTIKSAGSDQTREVIITRDKIVIPSIRGWKRASDGDWLYMIDDRDKIGYVRITSFATETASTLEKILVDLESQGVKGLVLDVRGNPGGLLSSAVDVADKFLNGGLVVRTQPRSGLRRWPSYESAKEKGTHPNYPLVILIDSSSASGSEILAGALADKSYKRAVLVGDRTHGKGSVQSATPYTGGGSKLKYTMAYYHLPSDQRVLSKEEAEKRGTKDWGVAPDVAVKLRSDELRKLIDVQRDNDVLMQADNGNDAQEKKRHSLDETITTDPQLAVGLLVVKAKLRQNEATLLAGNQ